MKIAITGANGLVGQSLTEELLKNSEHDLVLLTRDYVSESNYNYVVTDYSENDLEIKLEKVDILIHLAAKRGTSLQLDDYIENAYLTEKILKVCCKLRVSKVIFASSISVYSNIELIPWKENQILPKTMYGSIKLLCENICNLYSSRFGIKVISLRFAQIISPNLKNGIVKTFIDNAINGQPIHVFGKSNARRDYVYIDDVIAAIILAIKSVNIYGSLNIGSGESYSNLQIAEIINEIFGNKSKIIYESNLRETIESSLMDIELSKSLLFYYPKFNFYSAILDIKNRRGGKNEQC